MADWKARAEAEAAEWRRRFGLPEPTTRPRKRRPPQRHTTEPRQAERTGREAARPDDARRSSLRVELDLDDPVEDLREDLAILEALAAARGKPLRATSSASATGIHHKGGEARRRAAAAKKREKKEQLEARRRVLGSWDAVAWETARKDYRRTPRARRVRFDKLDEDEQIQLKENARQRNYTARRM